MTTADIHINDRGAYLDAREPDHDRPGADEYADLPGSIRGTADGHPLTGSLGSASAYYKAHGHDLWATCRCGDRRTT